MSEIKLNKKVIYSVIITAIVVFLVAYIVFKYYPEQKKLSDLNSYRKALYESISCQYSCPLESQVVENKTGESELLPGLECVKSCTSSFRALQISNSSVSDSELQADGLVNDITSTVNGCKQKAFNNSTFKVDTSAYFPCVSEDLISLKQKYSYLN